MPCSSAGAITAWTWSSRAAANSSVSASGPSSLPMPDSTTWRIISAPGEPPGSRVTMTRLPSASSRSARILIWVDLPAPSPPSKLTKRPRGGGVVGVSVMSELLGAGAEQSDHQLTGAVHGAPHGRSRADGGRRVERRLDGDIGAAPDLDHADRLTGLD